MHIGIDFGARMAGTTAVCYQHERALRVLYSNKRQDADLFCKQIIEEIQPNFVMIDAPLSLPAVYCSDPVSSKVENPDYFFRLADRQIRAMSPMFLGGLTARAMQLAAFFRPHNIPFYETWPTLLRQYFGGDERPDSRTIDHQLRTITTLELDPALKLNEHGTDSVLAWFAGWLKINGKSTVYGNETEGLIWC